MALVTPQDDSFLLQLFNVGRQAAIERPSGDKPRNQCGHLTVLKTIFIFSNKFLTELVLVACFPTFLCPQLANLHDNFPT